MPAKQTPKTPDVNTGNKRSIDDIVSPSDGPQGSHVNSPHPLRRKGSMPDLAKMHDESKSAVPLYMHGKTYNVIELVKNAVCSSTCLDAISTSIAPSVNDILVTALQPLIDRLDKQNETLNLMSSKIESQNTIINNLETTNKTLTKDLDSAKKRIHTLEKGLDDLEQYGRRSSLRFHRVPITSAQSKDTDTVIVKLCNDKLNLNPKLSVADIERSHTIGPVNDNKATIICKFKSWKTKQTVYMAKKNLKNHKSVNFNVFVTEDLTKQRQKIVKYLNKARIDLKVHSFWTNDGRIFYKSTPEGPKNLVNDLYDIEMFVPETELEHDLDSMNTTTS